MESKVFYEIVDTEYGMMIDSFSEEEMTEDDVQKLIAAVVSVVAVIAGILIPFIANAITNKKIAQKKE